MSQEREADVTNAAGNSPQKTKAFLAPALHPNSR